MRPIFIFTDDLLTHNYVEDANDAESQIIIYRISLMDTFSFCYDFKDLYFMVCGRHSVNSHAQKGTSEDLVSA